MYCSLVASEIEETAKKAVRIIGMQYNKLYRSPAELPSGTNSMSPLYRAIKNCLFSMEKNMQKRRGQLYREKDPIVPKLTPSCLTVDFEEFIVKEKSVILMDDFFPKYWLTFHMCSLPINDSFKEGLYVSLLSSYDMLSFLCKLHYFCF